MHAVRRAAHPDQLAGGAELRGPNTVGAFFTLFGLALLYARTGAHNFAQLQRALGTAPDALVVASFWLLASGFLVKAAVFPFHLWLDDAHAVAPTPASVIFSGVMVTAGLYAVARIFWPSWAPRCAGRSGLKRLLAFSTVRGKVLGGVSDERTSLTPRDTC